MLLGCGPPSFPTCWCMQSCNMCVTCVSQSVYSNVGCLEMNNLSCENKAVQMPFKMG